MRCASAVLLISVLFASLRGTPYTIPCMIPVFKDAVMYNINLHIFYAVILHIINANINLFIFLIFIYLFIINLSTISVQNFVHESRLLCLMGNLKDFPRLIF